MPAWRAVIEDASLADTVRSVIREIAVELVRPVTEDIALAEGRTGIALAIDYISKAVPGAASATVSSSIAEQLIAGLASEVLDPSFFGGFPGIAWGLGGLRPDLPETSFSEIDEALLEAVEGDGVSEHDLVSGLAGLGMYAISRLPSARGEQLLTRVAEALLARAIWQDQGLTWHTRPENLPPVLLDRYPDGYLNVGVAHGVPAPLYVLAVTAALGLPLRSDRLDRALEWLVSQADLGRRDSLLPILLLPQGQQIRPSRTAWCYGDLGASVVLLQIGRLLERDDLIELANRLALTAAMRSPSDAEVVDAGLCHGASGVGHIFGRIYQSTGDTRFRDAAVFWMRRTLELRQSGTGIGGYQTWFIDRWENRRGLLTGAAGIAAALAAAISDVDPSWDRFLLCSSAALRRLAA